MTDNTQRFSSRADDYARFRPHYPQAVLNIMEIECGLTTHHKIADVGSGTGILSELFLRNKNLVYGVEPNREMRAAAETRLKTYSWFISVAGTAEATTLREHSVDWVTAGQAFHWFDRAKARTEFLRILKPRGCVLLASNNRQRTTAFMRAYERVLQQIGSAYQDSCNRNVPPDAYADFFGAAGFKTTAIENHQDLDWEGLRGRFFSSSYTPEPENPQYEPVLAELRDVFKNHQQNGKVRMEYLTTVHYGRLA
jgi:ubiquinone/menaquinone biosynthesis C-methylase UbiE